MALCGNGLETQVYLQCLLQKLYIKVPLMPDSTNLQNNESLKMYYVFLILINDSKVWDENVN